MPIDLNEHLKRKREEREAQSKQDSKDYKEQPKRSNDNRGGGFGGGFNGGGFGNLHMPSMPSGKWISILVIVAILIVLFIIARPFVIVNSGEVGIKVNFGAYNPKPLPPGLHFFVPFMQEVIIVDRQVRVANFSSRDDTPAKKTQSIMRNDAIIVMDTKGMSISIELTVKYKLVEEKIPTTIADYGPLWEQKIIIPAILDVVRSAVGNYTTDSLPTKRDEVANLIYTGFKGKLDAISNQPVQLESIELREIVLPNEVRTRIEGVELAKRDAQKATEEANALRERAKGKADALEIEAKGQSEANRLINESLSQRLLDLRQIEMQGKFNEALKENTGAQIFLTPGGAVPNIWLDSKSKQKSTVGAQ